jgi:hypothetical protein
VKKGRLRKEGEGRKEKEGRRRMEGEEEGPSASNILCFSNSARRKLHDSLLFKGRERDGRMEG